MVPLPRLIALSPGDLETRPAAGFLAALEDALAAGLPGLLLREPRLGERAYLELGRAVAALRARFPALWLGVHDRAHLARALGADALHLGFRSLAARELRPWLGSEIALGLSTHAGDDPESWDGADYLFHGPLHATPSKAGRQGPVGLAGIARAVRVARRPLLALGGVTPADLAPLVRAGAHGAAVRAGILAAPDPARATRAHLAALADAAARAGPE